MNLRFTTGFAQVLVALGMTTIILGVLLGALVAFVSAPWISQKVGPTERVFFVLSVVGGGVVVGGSLIVIGQLVLAFLNVRENVERLALRVAAEDDVPCPYCAEHTKPEAALCPHCRSDLQRPTTADRLLTPR